MGPRVAVIGRGIIALSAAFRLFEAGFRVSLIGPRHLPGSGSMVAQGVSAIKGLLSSRTELLAAKMLGHRGLQAFIRDVEQASGRPIPHSFRGACEVFTARDEYQRLCRRIYGDQFTGAFGVKPLDRSSLAARVPLVGSLRRHVLGGLFYPGDGWYDPQSMLHALEAFLESHLDSVSDAVVYRVVPAVDRGLVLDTSEGTMGCDEAVIAAGPYSQPIFAASQLSLPPLFSVPGQVLRGPTPLNGDGVLVAARTSLVVANGELRYGASTLAPRPLVEAPPKEDLARDREVLLAALRDLSGYSLESLHGLESIWGLRARTKDRLPLLGAVTWPDAPRRVFVATGFYKNGLQLADFAARTLANLLSNQPVLAPFAVFNPQRSCR